MHTGTCQFHGWLHALTHACHDSGRAWSPHLFASMSTIGVMSSGCAYALSSILRPSTRARTTTAAQGTAGKDEAGWRRGQGRGQYAGLLLRCPMPSSSRKPPASACAPRPRRQLHAPPNRPPAPARPQLSTANHQPPTAHLLLMYMKVWMARSPMGLAWMLQGSQHTSAMSVMPYLPRHPPHTWVMQHDVKDPHPHAHGAFQNLLLFAGPAQFICRIRGGGAGCGQARGDQGGLAGAPWSPWPSHKAAQAAARLGAR